MDFSHAMSFINSYTKSGAPVKNLTRIKKLMKKLGDPQSSLSFVHIAGTNGKGSVLEMISCAFIDAEFKVGQFTSPYIVKFEDRIRINGKCISQDDICRYAKIVEDAVSNEPYSQFEIIFALSMLYFADKKVDIVCLEAGLGGLLDATNIIDCPKAAVIASISLDHTDILGNSVEEIAFQKAGIVKKGGFAVLSAQNDNNIRKVFEERAKDVHARLVIPKSFVKCSDMCFIYANEEYELSMCGDYQMYNACTAIEVLKHLSEEYGLTQENIKYGIRNARVRARFEKIRSNPDVYFDGAHNPDAFENLKNTLLQLEGKKIGIVGMLKSKDVESSVALICECLDAVICVDGFFNSALDRHALAEVFIKNGAEAYTASLEEAEKCALILAAKASNVIAFGSLYLYSGLFGSQN